MKPIPWSDLQPGDILNHAHGRVVVTEIKRIGTVVEVKGEFTQWYASGLFDGQPPALGSPTFPARGG